MSLSIQINPSNNYHTHTLVNTKSGKSVYHYELFTVIKQVLLMVLGDLFLRLVLTSFLAFERHIASQ